MLSEAELHIIVTPTHVDKVQLLATDDEGELVGLVMYQELIEEVQRFTHRANRILENLSPVSLGNKVEN